MPRFKGKASRGRSPGGPRGGGSSAGGYVGCDAQLVPRIQEYARGNDVSDVDDVVEHLRGCYREYLRKPMLVFRKGVERAIEEMRKRAPPGRPSRTIESLEAAHLERRGLRMADEREEEEDDASGEGGGADDGDSSEGSDEDSSEDDSEEGEEGEEEDALVAMEEDDPDARVMNAHLEGLYAGAAERAPSAPRDVAAAAEAAAEAAEVAAGSSAPLERGGGGDPAAPTASSPAGAFAAPHVVKAAAKRALDAEKPKTEKNVPKRPSAPPPAAAPAPPPPMSAAEAGHLAAMATARYSRLREIEREKSGGKRKGGRREKKRRRRDGADGGAEFGEDDFVAAYLPGGPKYRRGGSGNGPGDPFGLQNGDPGEDGFRDGGAGSSAFAPSAPREVSLSDLGGIEGALGAIRELILCPLTHPELYGWLGVDPPRGVLLHGPPGCGKTTLAHAIAREARVPFFAIAAPEIVAGVSGESEAKIRQLFRAAAAAAPSIIFIDEVDAIVPKRDGAQRQMESRIVAQLLASMDTLAEAVVVPGGEGLSSGEAEECANAPSGDGEEEEAAAVTARRKAHVTVIGATNRPDGMDAALRRAGRFDREIALGIPDEAARGRILAVQARRLRLAGGLDLAEIAKKTPGYVGADLSALAKEAAAAAVARIFQTFTRERGGGDGTLAKGDEGGAAADDANAGARKEKAGAGSSKISKNPGFGSLVGRLADRRPLDASELEPLAITTGDFAAAIAKVQPSARREGFTTTPAVTWEDVGSLAEVREELAFSVVEPIAHPSRFRAMGLATSTGVLLYGPPGCGKTLVAKATANEAKANFISIKGPELLNKYVGESERAVRTLFARARAASPCVLFFDELDSLAPRRGHSDGGNQASERVVNQLLTEMDGLEARSATFVVAATTRPDAIDPAMLRPGRLDKLLYVPLPPPDGRAAILKTLTRRTPLTPGLDVAAIAASARCEGFSGADLASLVREACVAALKGNLDVARAHDDARERARAMRVAEGGVVGGLSGEAPPLLGDEEPNAPPSDSDSAAPHPPPPLVTAAHFDAAFERVQPSVSAADQRRYDELRRKLRRERGSLAPRASEEGDDDAREGAAGAAEAPSRAPLGGAAKKRKA